MAVWPSLCPRNQDAARSAISRRFKRIADTSQMHIEDSQLLVCDAQSVKGLEYDAVIVAQPGLIAQEAPVVWLRRLICMWR